MITRTGIGDALAVLAATAPDKTPNPNEATMAAWAKYYDSHPRWTDDDLVAAAWEHAKTPRERMVQPADLSEIISSWYQDRLARMDPADREDAWTELGGGGYPGDKPQVRRDRYGYPTKAEDDEPSYPADWTSDQRIKAYWERVRSGVRRPGPDPVDTPAPDEHPPGEECADQLCPKPSTFGPYCARHYVLSQFGAVGQEVDRLIP